MTERKSLYQGRIVDLGLETAILPDGRELQLEIIRHPGAAVIAAVDDQQRVCMIRQFRYAAGGWIWELPAGVRDDGEAPDLTAERELKEEVGISAQIWISLGSMLSTPGFCDERLHLYLAQNLSLGEHAREADEFIEMHWVSMGRAIEMALSGEIDDAKTIVALFRVQAKLASLQLAQK